MLKFFVVYHCALMNFGDRGRLVSFSFESSPSAHLMQNTSSMKGTLRDYILRSKIEAVIIYWKILID